MSAPRYLIRIFAKGIDDWLVEHGNVEELAKVFDLAVPEQSVYEVALGEDEWLAIAGHKLSDPKKSPDATSILRIEKRELASLGICIDADQFGTSGVPWVDRRHRNLLASRDQLLELTRILGTLCARGADRVRRVGKPHIQRTLKRICDLPSPLCHPHVKRIAEWVLKEADRPNLSAELIRGEITGVEFEDEAIRPGAERRSTGDSTADWYASLGELREAYARAYVPTVMKRFGLK